MTKWETHRPMPEGLIELVPKVWTDPRGHFLETFQEMEFVALGIPVRFVQENQSCSRRGVIRGLHFQTRHPQGKLVRVAAGAIYDVAVDLRTTSSHFGKWYATELSARNQKMLYIPEGFAHGFIALEENTVMLYKCTDYYHAEDDAGIRWDDPVLAIDWRLSAFGVEQVIISPKDETLPGFAEYCAMRGIS